MPKFCHECGKKILDTSAAFCSGCGTSLASLAATRPAPAVAPARATFVPFSPTGDDDDEDLRVDRVNGLAQLNLGISSLDVEINIPKPPKETIGGLMASGPIDGSPTRVKLTKAEKKKIDIANLDAFKNEGGAIRPQTNSRKNGE